MLGHVGTMAGHGSDGQGTVQFRQWEARCRRERVLKRQCVTDPGNHVVAPVQLTRLLYKEQAIQ